MANDYDLEYVIVGSFTDEAIECYAERNVHGVPIEAIRRMAGRFKAPQI